MIKLIATVWAESARVAKTNTHPTQPYYCSACRRFYSVKSGTVWHSSKLGYQKLAIAIYLFVTRPKGVSAAQLSRDLDIAYTTAWHLEHRIRKAWENGDHELFKGPVEVDETFIGGRARNQTFERRKRLKMIPVIGMVDRATNKVAVEVIGGRYGAILKGFVYRHTEPTTKVHTDEARAYLGLRRPHFTVNHSKGQYGPTNGIESLWALFKRMFKGTYHKISPKHMHRYATELQERHNRRPLGDLARMASVVRDGVGKRLTYRDLTRGED